MADEPEGFEVERKMLLQSEVTETEFVVSDYYSGSDVFSIDRDNNVFVVNYDYLEHMGFKEVDEDYCDV